MGSAEPQRPGERRTARTAALATHLRDPMHRSAYALILATGLTSGLGLVFWALAAHWMPAAMVGIGAALVSAMALLANLSTLGLRNGLIRFLPTAGSATRRLIITCYSLCAMTAMAVAGIFLLGLPLWADQLAFLRSSPLTVLAFVLGTACWVLFVLQDHVLVGLRQAVWVPLENLLCALAKIALLPLLVLTGGWAVFGATVIPAAAAVLVVTILILRYARRTTAGEVRHVVPVTQLVRFAAADHVAALLWIATADVLTLLVLHQLGPEASAYYFMANTIGYTLSLVVSNIGSALVAEGARYPERTVDLARQALLNSVRLVVPLAVVGVLAAPLVLGILGPDYAAEGTVVLQLLLVSAVPQIIVGISVGTARIRRDLRMIMGIYTALALGSVGGSWLTLDSLGLTGVGLSCLMTQLVVSLVLLATGRTGLFHERGFHSVVAELEKLPLRLRRRRSRQQTRRQMGPALAACGVEPVVTDFRLLTSDCDTLVVAVESRGDSFVLKIATSAAASRGLDQHATNVARLRSRLGPTSGAALLPQLVRRGQLEANLVLLETRLPGTSAQDRRFDPATSTAAVAALTAIHQSTSLVRTVDAALLAGWVDEPLTYLRRLRGLPGDSRALDRLQHELHDALLGRQISTSWVHGDFWSGNVLVDSAPAATRAELTDADSDLAATPAEQPVGAELVRVTGLVDWENATDSGLPDADLVHWWLAAQPVELGAAARRAITDPAEVRRRLSELSITLPNPQLALEHVVLLTWLWHVTAGMNRTSADHLGRVWLARNVKPILVMLAGEAPIGPMSSRAS